MMGRRGKYRFDGGNGGDSETEKMLANEDASARADYGNVKAASVVPADDSFGKLEVIDA